MEFKRWWAEATASLGNCFSSSFSSCVCVHGCGISIVNTNKEAEESDDLSRMMGLVCEGQ